MLTQVVLCLHFSLIFRLSVYLSVYRCLRQILLDIEYIYKLIAYKWIWILHFCHKIKRCLLTLIWFSSGLSNRKKQFLYFLFFLFMFISLQGLQKNYIYLFLFIKDNIVIDFRHLFGCAVTWEYSENRLCYSVRRKHHSSSWEGWSL